MRNSDKAKQLRETLLTIGEQIQAEDLGKRYMRLLKMLENGTAKHRQIDDGEWEVMLAEERSSNILHYYHSLRIEYQQLLEERKGFRGSLGEWLDSPYTKLSLAGATLAQAALEAASFALQSGLFFQDEQPTQFRQKSSNDVI